MKSTHFQESVYCNLRLEGALSEEESLGLAILQRIGIWLNDNFLWENFEFWADKVKSVPWISENVHMRIKNCIYSAFTLENPMEIFKSCHWRCRSRSFWGCDWHWPEPEPGLVPVYHRWPGGWSHSLTEICTTRFFLLRSKFMIWT